MQLEMAFGGEERAAGTGAPGPSGLPGLLSGRPWRRAAAAPAVRVAALRRSLPLRGELHDVLLEVLATRGLLPEESEGFFFPSLDDLPDPLRMTEMETAARRLLAAAAAGERVAVHGDFDVDGLTGTAILAELLGELTVDGARVALEPPFVPDRLRDGYGVSAEQVRRWQETGTTLLVTVDTGVSAGPVIADAAAAGMETVVLDHHLFTERPPAVAVVNPRRRDERYPNRDLCGAGVAFKLVQAIRRLAPASLPPGWEETVLDLAALGLLADQMPLRGENRTLVSLGLRRLSRREDLRPGLAELLAVAGLGNGFPVTSSQVAYQLAPRLNACGRVGKVDDALRLLLTRDPGEARELAHRTDAANRHRREVDRRVLAEATRAAAAEREAGAPGLVLWGDGWHRGVIGISASRLVERFGVPVILLSREGDEARGSGRSIPGLDIKAVLDECAPLLERYGGHAQAAGLSLPAARLEAFRERFLSALRRRGRPPAVAVDYDAELPPALLAGPELAAFVGQQSLLEPFGEGHAQPVFLARNLELRGQPATVGQDRSHLRFHFRQPGGRPLPGGFISFGSAAAWAAAAREAGGGEALAARRWDVLLRLAPSTWRPRSGAPADPVQRELLDIRPAEATS